MSNRPDFKSAARLLPLLLTLLFCATLPAQTPPVAISVDYSASPNAPFTAEEVTVKAQGFQLAGTLLLPQKGRRPLPAAVLITGSGPQERDETLPFPNLKNFRPFRQMAEMLASRGIAVLRVDDRGTGASTGRETLATATTKDLADDTRAQVAYMRTRKEIDPRRIALVGHSEGGSIAPQVAVTDPQIAALVLMAGPGKTGAEISLAQQKVVLDSRPDLSPEIKKQAVAQQEAIIKAVVSGADLSNYPPEVKSPWVKEFWTYDPIPTMRRVRQPVLILQGELDQQITADQAALLEQAARAGGNKDVTTRVFPKLNHLFLPCETGNFDEYPKLTAQELPANVLQTLGDWLPKRLRAKP
jgi:dipeptidyl aminopeptidase/acylaminoacyl peptidase